MIGDPNVHTSLEIWAQFIHSQKFSSVNYSAHWQRLILEKDIIGFLKILGSVEVNLVFLSGLLTEEQYTLWFLLEWSKYPKWVWTTFSKEKMIK